MPINIKIDNFEGPFDLLLHLIKKNEMDIYNIKIFEITNQYIQYLKEMKAMDLEIASEFIVIASTLLEIKSKYLLPKPKQDELAVDSAEDIQKLLIDKLIEYKKFKAVAQYLRSRETKQGIIFSKMPEIINDDTNIENNEFIKNITMLDLFNIYNELVNRYKLKLNTNNIIESEIPADTFKIEDKIKYIHEIIKEKNKLIFTNVISECSSKIEVVVTFLAVLELIKLRVIKVIQENNFDEIYLEEIHTNEE